MKISGFSFVKNGSKMYYPIEESIRSILPICDEFIIAVGKSEDNTREVIENIGDAKIKIIDTNWDNVETERELILSNQTNVALEQCSGDWCFYVQADEVVHEDDLPIIKSRCEALLDNSAVEGLLFNYLHFWGDYDHYQKSHGWYPREIRVIRNKIGIRSVRDAQSFRLGDGQKLTVASANARIFHYGCVRPPFLMQDKQKSFGAVYIGKKAIEERYKHEPDAFDYGPLNVLPTFAETHPSVMKERIEKLDWNDYLRHENPTGITIQRKKHKHERLKNRILTGVEQFTGLDFNHKNWQKLLKV